MRDEMVDGEKRVESSHRRGVGGGRAGRGEAWGRRREYKTELGKHEAWRRPPSIRSALLYLLILESER